MPPLASSDSLSAKWSLKGPSLGYRGPGDGKHLPDISKKEAGNAPAASDGREALLGGLLIT